MRWDEFRDLLNRSVRHDLNWIKLQRNKTPEHNHLMAIVCTQLAREQIDFMTECTFKTGGRADIVAPLEGVIFEIVCSETEARLLAKKDYYPSELRIVPIRTREEAERAMEAFT